ncbi:IS3 family transposase [Streptomyces sp. NBC_01515]|uniref:IS3 family transposase n=1 Tax=Streptomyces sp. NBC_01515 TaxID=2903890 RepID=UPI00386E803A
MRGIHTETKGAYGIPRITRELREWGPVVNHKRIARLMRAAGTPTKAGAADRADAGLPGAAAMVEQSDRTPRIGNLRIGNRRSCRSGGPVWSER